MSKDSSANLIKDKLLNKKVVLPKVSKEPDSNTESEARNLDGWRQQIESRHLLQELKFRKNEHKQRIKYAGNIYRLILAWLVFIGLVVLASGLNFMCFNFFELSDNVLITLLTTTTVTVIGLFGTVLKYLYGK